MTRLSYSRFASAALSATCRVPSSSGEHSDILERVQKRLDDDPSKIPSPGKTVEHPLGTIKAWAGATHFKMKKMKNVATEMALHALAYITMRVMAIIGVPKLVEAMRGAGRADSCTESCARRTLRH